MKKIRAPFARLPLQANPDQLFTLIIIGLTLFGIILIYDTSVVLAAEAFGDPLWFFKNQLLWAALGLILTFVVSRIPYQWWHKGARTLFVVTMILLFLVLLPFFSSDVYGARRRLVLPLKLPAVEHINVQPAELAKLATVIYLAHLFSQREPAKGSPKAGKKGHDQKEIVIILTVLLLAGGLIMLEPDLGTTIILMSAASLVFFLSGASIREILFIGGVLASLVVFFTFSAEYRRARIQAFFNPSGDSQGAAYHVQQLLIALGSGGLWGVGLGHSRQKFQYLPEPTTDSIFAVLGEELGFLGTSLVLLALLFLVIKGFRIAQAAPDGFGYLMAAGLTSLLALQALINLGSVIGLLPLTGVPFPFLSYGGSSLTALLVGMGILLNISRQSSAKEL